MMQRLSYLGNGEDNDVSAPGEINGEEEEKIKSHENEDWKEREYVWYPLFASLSFNLDLSFCIFMADSSSLKSFQTLERKLSVFGSENGYLCR